MVCRQAARAVVLCLAVALTFDPYLLVLSWSADRGETLAATNLATCTQAMMAISEGRWLADDPPTGMQCVPGNGFSARALCIEGFNCEGLQADDGADGAGPGRQ